MYHTSTHTCGTILHTSEITDVSNFSYGGCFIGCLFKHGTQPQSVISLKFIDQILNVI